MAAKGHGKANGRRPPGALRIGTSGWHYDGWWGPFYPEDLRKKDALDYYATRFDAVELNAPFYRTPTEKAVSTWADTVPSDFRFAWKASKFITHWRRLDADSHSMELLESRLALLGRKLGPVLFQLPPKMQADADRLESFLRRLPSRRRHVFEFRHPSWYDKAIFDLLKTHRAALCISDHADAPSPVEATAGFVYLRLHGTSGRYHGSYGDDALAGWADRIRRWRAEGRDVWCFFDNDVKSAAPADAESLRRRLDGQ